MMVRNGMLIRALIVEAALVLVLILLVLLGEEVLDGISVVVEVDTKSDTLEGVLVLEVDEAVLVVIVVLVTDALVDDAAVLDDASTLSDTVLELTGIPGAVVIASTDSFSVWLGCSV